ncbi:translation initiation factor IF-2-like [Corvus cornix cornix]|uniref:translation initiation factor IF-2-like n=1 Tax=Corvus cornix cornix TaxID=932674 RepID=UPI00194E6B3E|nr:translation initiation factor IF-2-like [Corvus cornix cornix]
MQHVAPRSLLPPPSAVTSQQSQLEGSQGAGQRPSVGSPPGPPGPSVAEPSAPRPEQPHGARARRLRQLRVRRARGPPASAAAAPPPHVTLSGSRQQPQGLVGRAVCLPGPPAAGAPPACSAGSGPAAEPGRAAPRARGGGRDGTDRPRAPPPRGRSQVLTTTPSVPRGASPEAPATRSLLIGRPAPWRHEPMWEPRRAIGWRSRSGSQWPVRAPPLRAVGPVKVERAEGTGRESLAALRPSRWGCPGHTKGWSRGTPARPAPRPGCAAHRSPLPLGSLARRALSGCTRL